MSGVLYPDSTCFCQAATPAGKAEWTVLGYCIVRARVFALFGSDLPAQAMSGS
jgi:hypothetical protein